MPVYYAATLLFALGIFSVYPFGAIATTLSQGIVISLTAVLITLSLAAGALSYQWEGWNFAQQEKQVLQQFRQSDSTPYRPSEERQDWIPDTELVAGLQQNALKFEPVSVESGSEVMVSRVPFHSESTPATEWGFNQNLGPDLGLDQQDNFSALKLFPFHPFMFSRGIASGDVHNDGWDDIAVTSDSGVNLYANQQGQGYIEQQIHFPEMKNWYVTTMTLVDLNDDSWLDLFFTTYRQGNYVIYNQSGRFLAENIARLPNADDAFVTSATSFGDLDGDGDLDLVLGNWSQGSAGECIWDRQQNCHSLWQEQSPTTGEGDSGWGWVCFL